MATCPTPLISCICSTIADLDWLMEQTFQDDASDYIEPLRYRFRTLKMFVLSTETFDNDGSLGSLLVKLESNVRRVAENVRLLCLNWDGNPFTMSWPLTTSWLIADFLDIIQSSLRDIDEWYLTVFDDDKPRSSYLMADQMLEIINTFLESLVDFHSLSRCQTDLYKRMEALEEKLTFLKGLIYFAIHRSAEPIKDLLSHAEAVVIRAVYLLFNCRDGRLVVVKPAGITLEMSTFVQKMKLIEDINSIYAQTLLSSKFSNPSLASTHNQYDYMNVGDSSIAIMDIINYLISTLCKLQAVDTCHVVPVKGQLRELFEGLRSLRKILKQEDAAFDVGKLEDIVAVVCDAGFITFSCYQEHVELSLGLQDLLQKIKITLVEFGEECPQVQMVDLPKTSQLGFVDFMLAKLSELTSCEVETIGKSSIQTIQEELASLRIFLGETAELRHTQPKLQALWNRVLEMVYKVEDLIDHLMVGDLPYSLLTSSYDLIIKGIGKIKVDKLNTYHGKGDQEMEVKQVATTYYQKSSQRAPSVTHEVVGFVQERSSIMDRLTRGSKQLHIITIVGMPGIGKTTLASNVYYDHSVAKHFQIRAWFPVSQEVDKKKILLGLLDQIEPDSSYLKMTEDDLAYRLRQLLKGRTYLIFLDDIWDIKAWYNLAEPFPNDSNGSRIILTSRHFDVAPPCILDQEPLILSPLDEEDSWKLLQSRLLPANGWTAALHDLGIQIAEKCKGLPLTIVIVAGILATMEPEGWNKIMDALSTGIVSSTEQCYNTLELSFQHLPDYLKPCLLYFGAFREDEEVSVWRLLCLWIAEGFVPKAESKRVQDVAEDYLNALISRSLILVSKKRWDGGVKACRIHDLIHEFCLQKAKDEHFLHILKGQDQLLAFNEPQNLRRICIFSEAQPFKDSKLFCPRARSLFFDNSWPKEVNFTPQMSLTTFIHIFKLLRILDLRGISMGTQFPRELEQLIQLAFLAIHGHMTEIPPSIDKLSRLETLIMDPSGRRLSLPGSFWNLRKLRYLCIRRCGGRFPSENLESLPVLHELDRFSHAAIPLGAGMEMLMRKIPRIRELKYTVEEEEDGKRGVYNIVVPDFLNQLQSLHVSSDRLSSFLLVHDVSLPTHLKRLSLTHFDLSSRTVSILGKLPNLEVLKLNFIHFEGKTWEMEGDFPKLKMLKLYGSNLVEWRGDDPLFDQLQILMLEACKDLEEMPSCLEVSSTLERIEAIDCSQTVDSLVRKIEEELESYGNTSLRVIIRSRNLVTVVEH